MSVILANGLPVVVGGAALLGTTQSYDFEVEISVSAPISAIAPASFKFTANYAATVDHAPASGSYPAYTDLEFLLAEHYWTYSTTETGVWANAGPYGSQRNVLRQFGTGKTCMKCFETDGTHTVSVLVVFPDGRVGYGETTVTVYDPLTSYASSERIVLAPDGVFTGAPTHDVNNRVTSWAELESAYESMGTSKVAVLIDPSQTLEMDVSGIGFRTGDNAGVSEFYIGSWSRGTKCTLDFINGGEGFRLDAASGSAFKMEDLHFKGYYNPTTETGTPVDLVKCENVTEIVSNRCSDEGGGIAFSGLINPGGRWHINNHERDNWGDYLLLLGGNPSGEHAITGSRFTAKPDSPAGGRGKTLPDGTETLLNEHNGMRTSVPFVYVYGNYAYARHEWFGKIIVNPFLRLARANPENFHAVIACNTFEVPVVMDLGSVSEYNPRHVLFERNYCPIHHFNPYAFSSQSGLMTFRNNIFLKHNTPEWSGFGRWVGAVKLSIDKEPENGADEPIFGINNYIIDRSDDDNWSGFSSLFSNVGFNHVEEYDTLVHRPNTTPPAAQSVDDTSLGWNSAGSVGPYLNWVPVKNLEDFTVGTFSSGQNVGPSESIDIPYVDNVKTYDIGIAGGVQMGQADFSDADANPERHNLEINNDYVPDFSFSFGATAITVTNTSATETWLSSDQITEMFIDVGSNQTPKMDVLTHPAGTISLYRPTSAVTGDGDLKCAFDFEGLPRAGGTHPDAPAGTYQKGALDAEPV